MTHNRIPADLRIQEHRQHSAAVRGVDAGPSKSLALAHVHGSDMVLATASTGADVVFAAGRGRSERTGFGREAAPPGVAGGALGRRLSRR